MEKLKVGQSFEVVEVLENLGFSFIKGKKAIISKKNFVKYRDYHFDNDPENGALMYDSEIKPIGKLIITKVK